MAAGTEISGQPLNMQVLAPKATGLHQEGQPTRKFAPTNHKFIQAHAFLFGRDLRDHQTWASMV
jgi:hypothetical protein